MPANNITTSPCTPAGTTVSGTWWSAHPLTTGLTYDHQVSIHAANPRHFITASPSSHCVYVPGSTICLRNDSYAARIRVTASVPWLNWTLALIDVFFSPEQGTFNGPAVHLNAKSLRNLESQIRDTQGPICCPGTLHKIDDILAEFVTASGSPFLRDKSGQTILPQD